MSSPDPRVDVCVLGASLYIRCLFFITTSASFVQPPCRDLFLDVRGSERAAAFYGRLMILHVLSRVFAVSACWVRLFARCAYLVGSTRQFTIPTLASVIS